MDGDPLESWKDELTEEEGNVPWKGCHAKGAGMAEVDPILWTKMGVAKVEPAELNTSWS